MTLASGRLVYVVAKAPRAGAAKTRLCPPLRPEQAARLAAAFLLDCLALVQRAGCQARAICRDGAEQAALAEILDGVATVGVQAGRGLGDALETAFRQGLADGFGAVAVLGADSPTLPPAVLRRAFAALEHGADVALGPCEDGGYYLLAAEALHPQLFRNMLWSTNSVADVTIQRCRDAGLSVHLLPVWYDVDDAESLGRLRAALEQAPPTVAPHTRAELANQAAARVPPGYTASRRVSRRVCRGVPRGVPRQALA